mmetsp:Transcript_15306/g.14683  ORF Transcript_15306/g.14683 Transcript_15306/m.14683 type:complete len:497 (+) Transcript_15306:157-1647(+)
MVYLNESLLKIQRILHLSSQLNLEKSSREHYNKKLSSRSGSFPSNRIGVVKSTKRVINKVTTQRRQSRSLSQQINSHGLISIKFLVSNRLAGLIIGSGGASIRELIEVTKARVSMSSKDEYYPGTNDRVLLITGRPNEVMFAQCLVWDLMAIQISDEEDGRRTVWSPRNASRDTNGAHDDTQISGRLTIPATAAGLIIGRAGATIRSISEESGATLSVNSNDGTNERTISIGGSKQSCSECLILIIEKLVEGGEVSQYDDDHHMEQSSQDDDSSQISALSRGSRSKGSENNDFHDPRKVIRNPNNSRGNTGSSNWLRGLEFEGDEKMSSRDGRSLSSSMNFSEDSNHNQNGRNTRKNSIDYDDDLREIDYSRGSDMSRRAPLPLRKSGVDHSLGDSRETRGGNRDNGRRGGGPNNAEILSTNTVIHVAVSDDHIGKIMGKQSHILNEIMNLSAARITISPRGEYIEGTRNRLVTVTGAPVCAQTAHMLIAQKLNQE